jgi:signal transduction histidine kinase
VERPKAAKSILIVEDSAADRALCRRALAVGGDADYRIREASSVGDALEALAGETPDCVLLDYRLPDGTGLDLIEALLARDGSLRQPVVMLTGAGSETVAVEAMKAGAADYVTKGTLSAEALAEAIERAIEKSALERELARRADELEQLAYVVSHDLRAPLRTVHQNAQLLERAAGERLEGDARAHLERVLAGTRRMDRLIVELVEYCRIGRTPSFGAVALGEVVEQVLCDLEAAIVEAEAELVIGALPVVWGDALRLRQLFQNLIGNALKFRGAKPPRVVVEARREDDGWRITVADDGIGIEAQYLERIFEVFQRLPGAADVPGTGIGLAICRKIAQQHGSRVDVDSRPGAGTTFSLVLAEPDGADKDAESPR